MRVTEKISCHNYVEADGFAYFSNWFYNGLFKVEILTGKTYFLGCFNGEKYSAKNLHWEIFLKNKRIYFCPWRSKHVHIYNLEEKSLVSVKFKNESEEFYKIEKVILDNNKLFLIPEEKENCMFELDINSLCVTRISGRQEIHGSLLSKCKDFFPAGELIKKYGIERADKFWWRQVYQGVWYGFLPLGRHLLKYTEGRNDVEYIPLNVVNETRLKEYLVHVERQILIERLTLGENIDTRISDFLNMFANIKTDDYQTLRLGKSNGEKIWKVLAD